MSNEHNEKKYPDLNEFYRRREARRQIEAKLPVSQKIATVEKLRKFESSLAEIRKANKAKRAAKQIKIKIKTR